MCAIEHQVAPAGSGQGEVSYARQSAFTLQCSAGQGPPRGMAYRDYLKYIDELCMMRPPPHPWHPYGWYVNEPLEPTLKRPHEGTAAGARRSTKPRTAALTKDLDDDDSEAGDCTEWLEILHIEGDETNAASKSIERDNGARCGSGSTAGAASVRRSGSNEATTRDTCGDKSVQVVLHCADGRIRKFATEAEKEKWLADLIE